jgi:hypothetical protein
LPYLFDQSLPSRARTWTLRQLRRLPGVEAALRLRHLLARDDHWPWLPALPAELQGALRALALFGLLDLPLAALGVPAEEMLAVTGAHVARLREETPAPGAHSLHVPPAMLLAHPQPYAWGLAPALVNLAELHFGLPVEYLGVDVKRELADGVTAGTRQWHLDPEDERMLKLILYLDDVDDGAGPFEALDAASTERVCAALGYRWGDHFDDEAVARVVPRSAWRRCTGPRHTAVLVDPARCLHRASPPTRRDRYSMTFSYTSRRAYFAFRESRELQAGFVAAWGHRLDARERACVRPA